MRLPFVDIVIFGLIPQDIARCKSNRLALGFILGIEGTLSFTRNRRKLQDKAK
jgi:hypothetical protein